MASGYFSAAVSLQTAELQTMLQMLAAVSDLREFCVESNVMLCLCSQSLLEQGTILCLTCCCCVLQERLKKVAVCFAEIVAGNVNVTFGCLGLSLRAVLLV